MIQIVVCFYMMKMTNQVLKSMYPHVFTLINVWMKSFTIRVSQRVDLICSQAWSFKCVFRLLFLLKLFPHTRHRWGLSPVWVTLWVSMSPFRLNRRPQSAHWYGRSPVWILMCKVKAPLCLNFTPHSLHWYGFSPVWILTWSFKWLDSLKRLPQMGQVCLLSLVRLFKSSSAPKLSLPSVHRLAFCLFFGLVPDVVSTLIQSPFNALSVLSPYSHWFTE